MKRVMIVGGPGSGKSTLALELGQASGLPVHHMDHLHWEPGWKERPKPEKVAMAHEIERGPAWIFEGGLSATYDHRAHLADTLIWLDLPVSLRLWRVTRRMVRSWGQTRVDMAPGCPEGLRAGTPEFYAFIWRTRHSHRAKLARLAHRFPHLRLYHLRSRAEVSAFRQVCGLEKVANSRGAGAQA
jgi:adenylate kinase family enzyme